ncbi:Wadjet anti-phage system protein JetD domain-containing protein [Anaerobacillus isosaccharinicus]|uniref:Wadjet protein JetD C-terminal domain-containing protein n=1 Tax=Anaerobacillus isosaccharinicus TaxID=1532552 RepID=A0A1S2LCD7_9BACI|nr:Wadjet anti-phage system protein JetD domain-containing protein [Anaerobacillus isosaccharinicus]MBA5584843.1 hypothetical protein [Anaerobacillus isosaccharinicus]QOY36794.1 hypothetical protein AWH56_003825 [Anaerobacillus isosaccharinicus]
MGAKEQAKEIVMAFLRNYPKLKKKIESLVIEDELIEHHPDVYRQIRYEGFYEIITELEAEHVIKRIKNSGTNKKRDALYKVYTITLPEKVVDVEIRNDFHPLMDMIYYRTRLKNYAELEPYFLKINDFLSKEDDGWLTLNERSFQIFRNEKWLDKNKGVLKNIGLSIQVLRCYKTYEPFMYYAREIKQKKVNALIIENKDSFHTFKELFKKGYCSFYGTTFDFVIYGEGKKIISSFAYLDELEAYRDHTFTSYYFGDIDPEGINIWKKLNMENHAVILPFVPFYSYMVNEFGAEAPKMGKDQLTKFNDYDSFYTHFPKKECQIMKRLLRERRYLPQEALHRNLLKEMSVRID